MDMWSASQRRYFQGLRPPGSARVSRAGERVLAIANFVSIARRLPKWRFKKACFGATPKPARETGALPRRGFSRGLLDALFKGGGFAAQVRQNFAGEMQRAGDQDRIWLLTRKHQRVANGCRDGVGE